MIKWCFFTLCLLMCFHTESQAKTLVLENIQATELDGAFTLLNDHEGVDTVLDCASFIHHLSIEYEESSYLFHLSSEACIKDFEFLNKLPKEKRCLHFDESNYYFDDCSN